MQHLITASKFNKWSSKLLPFFLTSMLITFIAGIYLALIASPQDYQQGETVRIMYVHVPAAWLTLSIYFIIALSSASYLIWRNPLSAIFIKSLLPIGISFCFICLVTGMLWGKPIWGVYWAWDARLTAVLILFIMYAGLIMVLKSIENEQRALKTTAIIAIIGAVNLPIIRFSVKWWNTLHQPASVMRFDSPAIHNDILIPLIVMFLFFLFFFLSVFLYNAKTEILKKKNQRKLNR